MKYAVFYLLRQSTLSANIVYFLPLLSLFSKYNFLFYFHTVFVSGTSKTLGALLTVIRLGGFQQTEIPREACKDRYHSHSIFSLNGIKLGVSYVNKIGNRDDVT